GRRSAEGSRSEGSFHYRERRSGHFVRRLRLPASVDQEQIHADFRNGVLRVTLPKLARERKPQRSVPCPRPVSTRVQCRCSQPTPRLNCGPKIFVFTSLSPPIFTPRLSCSPAMTSSGKNGRGLPWNSGWGFPAVGSTFSSPA